MKNKKNISTAILAGGESKRMGQDKASLMLNNVPMAHHVSKKLYKATGVEPVLVTKNTIQHEHLGLTIVPDCHKQQCALAGIYAALKASKTDRVLIATCDQPFLSVDLLKAIIKTEGDIVICETPHTNYTGSTNLEPFPGIYSKSMLKHFKKSLKENELSVQKNLFAGGLPIIINTNDVMQKDSKLTSFINTNTPEELAKVSN